MLRTMSESLEVTSRPLPAERTGEDQPFVYVPRNSDDASIRVDILSGSISLTASQLVKQEALSWKNAAAASNVLSMALSRHARRVPDCVASTKVRFGNLLQFFLERSA